MTRPNPTLGTRRAPRSARPPARRGASARREQRPRQGNALAPARPPAARGRPGGKPRRARTSVPQQLAQGQKRAVDGLHGGREGRQPAPRLLEQAVVPLHAVARLPLLHQHQARLPPARPPLTRPARRPPAAAQPHRVQPCTVSSACSSVPATARADVPGPLCHGRVGLCRIEGSAPAARQPTRRARAGAGRAGRPRWRQ